MQKITKLIIVIICCACTGVLYYAWQQQWIIITFTTNIQNQSSITTSSYTKKRATLYGWLLNRWATEPIDILWSSEESYNTQQLIQAVLNVACDEHIISKKIAVERVLPHYQTSQLLVFLDQSPFSKSMSIHTKLMLIESMLKTLRENGVKPSGLYFLVNNQPLYDQHLDFRQAWPIDGFCHA